MSEPIATLDDLFGRPCGRRFKVTEPLPVKGVPVRIRSLTEREVSAYNAEAVATKGDGLRKDKLQDATRRLIALCVVDQDGNPLIPKAKITEIADWDAADTAFLYQECARFCGINTSDIEVLAKNSETTSVVG